MDDKKTAYIIGTGPSLNKIDIKKLAKEKTITFNRAYIAFDDWGFTPTYYLAIDGNDIRSCYKDINNLVINSSVEKFFLYKLTDNQKHFAKHFQDNDFKGNEDIYVKSDKIILLNAINGNDYSPKVDDLTLNENILTTSILPNAGFMGLKALLFLGYKRIVLVGMDSKYQDDTLHRNVQIDGGSYEAENNDDINHFRSDYFGKNITFGKPNQNQIITIWENFINKTLPKHSDIEIISCTEGSNLNRFIKYIPFEEFIGNNR